MPLASTSGGPGPNLVIPIERDREITWVSLHSHSSHICAKWREERDWSSVIDQKECILKAAQFVSCTDLPGHSDDTNYWRYFAVSLLRCASIEFSKTGIMCSVGMPQRYVSSMCSVGMRKSILLHPIQIVDYFGKSKCICFWYISKHSVYLCV